MNDAINPVTAATPQVQALVDQFGLPTIVWALARVVGATEALSRTNRDDVNLLLDDIHATLSGALED